MRHMNDICMYLCLLQHLLIYDRFTVFPPGNFVTVVVGVAKLVMSSKMN